MLKTKKMQRINAIMRSYKKNECINNVARQNHLTKESVQDEMQKALDEAWASNDPEKLKMQKRLFPDGKPSVEEFIQKMQEVISLNR